MRRIGHGNTERSEDNIQHVPQGDLSDEPKSAAILANNVAACCQSTKKKTR